MLIGRTEDATVEWQVQYHARQRFSLPIFLQLLPINKLGCQTKSTVSGQLFLHRFAFQGNHLVQYF